MQLREARAADAGAVVALWTQGYVDEGEGGRTEAYVEADFHETAAAGTVFVAEDGGGIVGVVALLAPGVRERAVAHDGEAELRRLAVSHMARAAGVGTALVRRCEQLARSRGWEAIALWSRPYQRAAHRLYESLGYERVPDRDSVDETGFSRLVFRLPL